MALIALLMGNSQINTIINTLKGLLMALIPVDTKLIPL